KRMSLTYEPRSTGKQIVAVDANGTEVTLEIGEHMIFRKGEQGTLALEPKAYEVLARPSSALRDATRWREDAANLSSFVLDGITYTRGAVLGEWNRSPNGTFDAKLVEALVEAVATLRAPVAAPPRAVGHTLRVTFSPPVGDPTMHEIELAAPTEQG